MQLFPSKLPPSLVTEREDPEDPLAVDDMQDFADELSGPLFSINPVIPQGQVFMLHVKEVSGDLAFHETLPAYDVLAFS